MYKSSSRNQYVFILYYYNGNAIISRALKSRRAEHIRKTWENCYTVITRHINTIKLHILDNEASHSLKAAMADNQMEYKLVPSDDYCHNTAERAIQK